MKAVERIVDTFLFSEAHEAVVLLAKLHVESEVVLHWVAIENSFTTKGEWKGHCLKRLLHSDLRFRPFLERITVVETRQDFTLDYRRDARLSAELLARRLVGKRSRIPRDERRYFHAEVAQRDAGLDTALAKLGGSGWIMVSDVDEMLDGSSVGRGNLLRRALASNARILHLPSRRFVFDFNNISMARFRHVPMIHTSALSAGSSLGRLRNGQWGVVPGPDPLIFEYSYCYSKQAIHRKLDSFAHIHPGVDVLDRALECNHALIDISSTRLRSEDLFKVVDTEEAQHPAYVSEHLDEWMTQNVNPQYSEARGQRYPALFREP